MATATKHVQRSHYSSHNYKPFTTFTRRAAVISNEKTKRKSLVDMLKGVIHNTANK